MVRNRQDDLAAAAGDKYDRKRKPFEQDPFHSALAQAARPRRARHDPFLQGIESRFEILTEVGAETDAL